MMRPSRDIVNNNACRTSRLLVYVRAVRVPAREGLRVERPRGAQILAWNAGVFKSARRCTRVGVNTVQRRLNDFGPSARVWYECQPLNGPL